MPEISWDVCEKQIAECTRCPLHSGATHKVPGQGPKDSPLMLIGEGPGRDEDLQGLAFVGASGQLLTRMLASVGIDREKVYICNIVKCRPPDNRIPTGDEAEACKIHLRNQVYLVRPKIIVLLGATAAKHTLDPAIRITKERGQWQERKGIWMMATYHPSALLRDPSKKKDAWADMQSLRDKLKEFGLYDAVAGSEETA